MPSKILSKRTLLLAIILSGLTLFLSLFFYFIPQNSIPTGSASVMENANTLQKQEQTISELPASPVGKPARFKIPNINVDAPVEYVGLTSDGAMDVPKGPDNVAWFNLGPRPGENGSAIMVGHYGRWKNGSGSVFDNLNKLVKGDKIYVKNDKDKTITFVVRAIKLLDRKADATEVFTSDDGLAHLNLVTCEGVWNRSNNSYPERRVIFTNAVP